MDSGVTAMETILVLLHTESDGALGRSALETLGLARTLKLDLLTAVGLVCVLALEHVWHSRGLPRCAIENATRPSRATAGLPITRAPGALHSSVALPSASFQMLSPSLIEETYRR